MTVQLQPTALTVDPVRTTTYVSGLLQETREEIARADAKATSTLSAVGVAVTIVAGALTASGFHITAFPWWQVVLMALVALAQAGSLYCLAAAVWPRVTAGQAHRAYFFADVVAAGEAGLDLQGLVEVAAVDSLGRDLQQLQALSGSVARKYRYTRWGIALTGAAIGGAVVLVVARLL